MFGEFRDQVTQIDLELRANWRGALDELNKIEKLLRAIPRPTKKIQSVLETIEKRRDFYEMNLSL